MNLDQAEVLARDVFGRRVPNTAIDVEEIRDQGGKHYVATVSAPGFLRDRVVLDFNGRAELVMLMDPEQWDCPGQEFAAALAIRERIEETWIGGLRLGDMIGRPVVAQRDRVWYPCHAELRGKIDRNPSFRRVPSRMHSPPDGYEFWAKNASYKTREPNCSLQLTFYKAESDHFVEADIDVNNRLLAHAWDALIKHPITGQPDSRLVAQMSVYYTGIPLGFDMVPKEQAA